MTRSGVYTDTIKLIRTHEMGAGVARALGAHRAVLLKNHGVVVTGKSIEEAVISAIMLENAAMVQLAAEAAGDPAPEFSRTDIGKLKHDISQPEQFKVNFDYLARRVKRARRHGESPPLRRHGRTCSGHPRLCSDCVCETWIPATSAGMTTIMLKKSSWRKSP